MNHYERKPFKIIIVVLLALMATILPLPAFCLHIRPALVLMVYIFLLEERDDGFNRFYLVLTGLIMDTLLGSVMGQHALALVLATWLASSKNRRFRFYSLLQQTGLVGLYALVYFMTLVGVDLMTGQVPNVVSVMGSWAITTALWPWLSLVLQDLLPSPRHLC